jgi:hypothetical protein
MKKKKKNNKILPATSACCGTVVRNKCRDHFSIYNTLILHSYLYFVESWFYIYIKPDFGDHTQTLVEGL